jgi:hypothetical protein
MVLLLLIIVRQFPLLEHVEQSILLKQLVGRLMFLQFRRIPQQLPLLEYLQQSILLEKLLIMLIASLLLLIF